MELNKIVSKEVVLNYEEIKDAIKLAIVKEYSEEFPNISLCDIVINGDLDDKYCIIPETVTARLNWTSNGL